MAGWLDGWMDGWMDGCMEMDGDGWRWMEMDGWMDGGWMNGRLRTCAGVRSLACLRAFAHARAPRTNAPREGSATGDAAQTGLPKTLTHQPPPRRSRCADDARSRSNRQPEGKACWARAFANMPGERNFSASRGSAQAAWCACL